MDQWLRRRFPKRLKSWRPWNTATTTTVIVDDIEVDSIRESPNLKSAQAGVNDAEHGWVSQQLLEGFVEASFKIVAQTFATVFVPFLSFGDVYFGFRPKN